MLAAIFRINNDNYYLETNDNSYNIVLSNNSETRILTEVEAKQLLDNIFGGKKTFKEKCDGYDVYIDESGNKRFFKDGREDFEKFYYTNGEDALLYYDDQYDDNILKRFYIKNKEAITGFVIGSLLAVPIWNAYDAISHTFYYDGNKIVIVKEMTTDLAKDYINDSSGIDEEMKDYLINEDFFNDILNISDHSRNYILNKKLDDITVKYDEEKCKKKHVGGFYNITNPNVVTLQDESYIDYALAHEFVHLMQDNNIYHYILEASAEMLAQEYYDSRAVAYPKQRENLRILLEMIGPKPIMELNFKGDISSFEKSIYDNLDKEKADRLLKLFTTSPHDDKKIKEKDKEVRSLLNDMSYNMTGMYLDDINNDILVLANVRSEYFNKHLLGYFEDSNFINPSSLPIDFEKVDISNLNYYEYITRHEITEEEYENCKANKLPNERVFVKDYSDRDFHIEFDRKNHKSYYNFDGELLTISEAREKGYFEKKYFKEEVKSCDSYDELKKEMESSSSIRVHVPIENEKILSIKIDNMKDKKEAYYIYNGNKTILSLEKKFPEQFDEDVEILNINEDSNNKNRLR
ncbi:MAG: hypothetical protein IJI43_03605 [Bacilli bacterium]|nr:hypothetical protein [Bacilli bacterium]